MTTMTKPAISSKLVRCRKCFRLLCKRIPIHDGTTNTYIVHVKHKGMEIYTFDATITCPACRSLSRISGEHGILETELNAYAKHNQ